MEGKIQIPTKSYSVGYGGDRVDVELETNIEYEVEISEEAKSWVELMPDSRATFRTDRISFMVRPNPTGKERVAIIEINKVYLQKKSQFFNLPEYYLKLFMYLHRELSVNYLQNKSCLMS